MPCRRRIFWMRPPRSATIFKEATPPETDFGKWDGGRERLLVLRTLFGLSVFESRETSGHTSLITRDHNPLVDRGCGARCLRCSTRS
jgi:hypothetical protein